MDKFHRSVFEPKAMSLESLKEITNNFSNQRELGRGTFGKVYKGLLQNGDEIAVKMLRLTPGQDDDEQLFMRELRNLWTLRHQNIVRLLGYCYEIKYEVVDFCGKLVPAENIYRALCFEYMHNGSLRQHLYDECYGHDWKTRYKIIKGTCEGLKYLHEGLESPMYHLDLKPENILLDKNMVPKLADFGLSKLIYNEQTQATQSFVGTMGYLPPEFIEKNLVSSKLDIFSLGVVMIRIITGYKGYSKKADVSSSQEFLDLVYENWRNRLATSGCKTLEAKCHQVKRCTEIALDCVQDDRKKRPAIGDILLMLDELEEATDMSEAPSQLQRISVAERPGDSNAEILHSIVSSEFIFGKHLDVYALEFYFPVILINRTDHHVGVWITVTYPQWCPGTGSSRRVRFLRDQGSLHFHRLGPHSTKVLYYMNTIMEQQQQQRPLQSNMGTSNVVMIATESGEALRDLESYLAYSINVNKFEESLDRINGLGLGTRVHRTTCDPVWCQEVLTHKFVPATREFGNVSSIDVHPTEAWVLVAHYAGGYASIWNYDTHEGLMVFQVTDLPDNCWWRAIHSAKFIVSKQWIAAGDGSGSVHVYDYTTMGKVMEFGAHDGTVDWLAVHPTDPLLLTASTLDKSIRLWDWEHAWTCTRVFETDDTVWHLTIGPTSTNTFASASYSRHVKVWNIQSSEPIATLRPAGEPATFDNHRHFLIGDIHSPDPIAALKHSGEPTFYTDNSHRHFLVTAWSNTRNNNANIWDLQTQKHVHTLCMGSDWDYYKVASHPTLPILATITESNIYKEIKHIFLWDARTYRLTKRVELFCADGPVISMVFDGTKKLTSRMFSRDINDRNQRAFTIDQWKLIKLFRPVLETDQGVCVLYHGQHSFEPAKKYKNPHSTWIFFTEFRNLINSSIHHRLSKKIMKPIPK